MAATPVHRCVVEGAVTFQRDPCPPTKAREVPSVERLNAEQKKRDAANAAGRAGSAAAPATKSGAAQAPSSNRTPDRPAAAGTQARPAAAFRCDGRRYCSQMTSCEEAKYFLANCPGVEMDGDRDGIPCEQQWCGR